MTKVEVLLNQFEGKYQFYELNGAPKNWHGQIDDDCIYINADDSDFVQAMTILHEISHSKFDSGDMTDNSFETEVAEYSARINAQVEFYKIYYGYNEKYKDD